MQISSLKNVEIHRRPSLLSVCQALNQLKEGENYNRHYH